MKLSNKTYVILIILLVIGIFLRFFNLDWGAPYYFHPDERNMAFSVTQLSFPDQMNPNFFAYGSLPLYAIFFTGLLSNFFTECRFALTSCTVSFEQAILISRFFSALFSVGLIPLLFLTGKKLYGQMPGLLAATLATISVGFIQFAHFGTTEMWLTCFSLLFFYLLLHTERHISRKILLLLGVTAGVLISTKVSTAVLFILPFPVFLFSYKKHHSTTLHQIRRAGLVFFLFLWVAGVVYLLTNPFVILDTTAFLNSMRYESTLATGSLPVFYTQEFFDTVPLLYQFSSIYPFLLNPLVTVFFLPAFLYLTVFALKRFDKQILLLLCFFLILFFSQALLFVKWTRYMVPTLPFIYLIFSGALYNLAEQLDRSQRVLILYRGGLSILLLVSSFIAGSYFITVYGRSDTRIEAAAWAEKSIPHDAQILSEVYDLGIIPFNDHFANVALFNFYELDETSTDTTPEQLSAYIEDAAYVILPSQRLYKTRLKQQERFPLGHEFYTGLNDETAYRKLYETHCDMLCQIVYLGDPVFSYEGTATVFDRPTVMIYQKL